MKKITLSILLAFFATSLVSAQTNLLSMGFEEGEDGEGTAYRSNTFNDGAQDVWVRWKISEAKNGLNSNFTANYSGFSGDYAFGGEDFVTTDNPLGNAEPSYIVFKTIDVSALQGTDINMSALLGASEAAAYENADSVIFEYAFDANIASGASAVNAVPTLGNIQTGVYTTAGRLNGDNIKDLSDDADLGNIPIGDGVKFVLSNVLQKVTYPISIPATASTLSVRIQVNLNGGSEEIVIDDFSIDTSVTLSNTLLQEAKTSIYTNNSSFVSTDASLTIEVYNTLGQKVNNSGLVSGIYILKVTNAQGEIVTVKKAI